MRGKDSKSIVYSGRCSGLHSHLSLLCSRFESRSRHVIGSGHPSKVSGFPRVLKFSLPYMTT